MKILDRYILKTFIVFFLITLLVFLALILIVKFVDELDDITKYHVPARVTFEFLFYYSPLSLSRVVPMSVVISVLLLLITLNLHHELIAIQTSGIPKSRLIMVVLPTALIISLALWYITDNVVPRAIQQSKLIRITKIEKRQPSGYVAENQTWLRGPSGEFYSIGLVGSEAKLLKDIRIIKLNLTGNRIVSEWYINTATWNGKESKWLLDGYRERIYDSSQFLSSENTLPKKTQELAFTPKDFIQVVQTPDQMDIQQLRNHLQLLRQGGLDTRESLTLYYLRFANVLSPIILAIIGLGYGFVLTRSEITPGVARAILMAILYTVLTQFGITLGRSGILPPMFSAWMANLAIGSWGIYRLRQIL